MATARGSSGGQLSCVAYTHDAQGSFLLAASGHNVKLFSTATGAQVRRPLKHTHAS